MKILVLVKEVPVVADIHIDRETLTVDRSGAGKMMNPADRNAVEAALQLADAKGGEVTVISMGPESCETVLREAISLGVTNGLRITDNAFSGADTLVTSKVLKAAAEKEGPFDAIFCGSSSIDGETSQIPAKLAAMMGMGILSDSCSIEIGEEGLTANRKAGSGFEKQEAKFPLVCSVTGDANEPRKAGLKGKSAAKKAEIPVLTNAELNLADEDLKSPTRVVGLVPPPAEEKGQMIDGADDAAKAEAVLDILASKHYI